MTDLTEMGIPAEKSLEPDFCVGPHCRTIYWDCGDGKFDHHTAPSQGPCEFVSTSILERKRTNTQDTWVNLSSFPNGLIDAGLSRLPPRNSPLPNKPPYQSSVQTHRDLLRDSRAMLVAISTDSQVQKAVVPTLFHPDLHRRNIFASDTDTTEITGIINWQSCSIEPAFWYADEFPDFVSDTSSPCLLLRRLRTAIYV